MTTVEGGCTRARRRRRSHALPRRKTVRWSPAEVDGLLEGVREHGVGKWAAILRSSACFNAVRTSVDLKDKWRNLAAHVRALALQSNNSSSTSPSGVGTNAIGVPSVGIPTSATTTTTNNVGIKQEVGVSTAATVVSRGTHQSHRALPYSAAAPPPPPPPPLHPTSTLPPLAPSTTAGYPQSAINTGVPPPPPVPPRYTPRVLAPLPVPSLTPGAEDAVAVAAAAAHSQLQQVQVHHHSHHHPHAAAAAAAAHHAHHAVSADLSYFGDSFAPRPTTADTLAQLRSLPPPATSQHHTHHDAVPTAASPSAPPPALSFDPFPEPDL